MINREKEIDRALNIRKELLYEIKHGTLSRREMYKKLLFGGGALAALSLLRGGNGQTWAQTTSGIAPPTTPFTEELVHVNRDAYVKVAERLTPEPTQTANTSAGGIAECGRDSHSVWDLYWANYKPAQRKTYLLTQQVVSVQFHTQLPAQDMWGFDGKVPGPTFRSRYGEPVILRIVNRLPNISEHRGFGCPETTTHLHNGHTPSASDGNPDNYFPRQAELDPATTDTGRFRDHHYPNIYAGNDPREALGTLWYHDHRHDFTAPNVYRGLAGFHLMFDELDSGNESDRNAKALRLPSGEYDVPLMVTDRFFDSNGVIQFDQFNFDGIIGNKYLVNGKIQPRFGVEPRKYRLRILNPGVSRTYGFALMVSDSPNGLVNAKAITEAFVIGTGGNLLPAPIPLRNGTPLGASQRLDIVVDFSNYRGRFLFLVNRFEQINGRQPEGYLGSGPDGPQFKLMVPGDAVMRFDVGTSLPRGDTSQLPAKLRELPWQENDAINSLSEAQIVAAIGRNKPFPGVETVREWKFEQANGMWAINGQIYDGSRPSAVVGKNTAEIWVLQGGGSWLHPIHHHFEEHRTLFRSGIKPRSQHLDYGRDDTMALGAGERGIFFRRFRDFTGKYVIHCHNVVHEDHAMMARFDVV